MEGDLKRKRSNSDIHEETPSSYKQHNLNLGKGSEKPMEIPVGGEVDSLITEFDFSNLGSFVSFIADAFSIYVTGLECMLKFGDDVELIGTYLAEPCSRTPDPDVTSPYVVEKLIKKLCVSINLVPDKLGEKKYTTCFVNIQDVEDTLSKNLGIGDEFDPNHQKGYLTILLCFIDPETEFFYWDAIDGGGFEPLGAPPGWSFSGSKMRVLISKGGVAKFQNDVIGLLNDEMCERLAAISVEEDGSRDYEPRLFTGIVQEAYVDRRLLGPLVALSDFSQEKELVKLVVNHSGLQGMDDCAQQRVQGLIYDAGGNAKSWTNFKYLVESWEFRHPAVIELEDTDFFIERLIPIWKIALYFVLYEDPSTLGLPDEILRTKLSTHTHRERSSSDAEVATMRWAEHLPLLKLKATLNMKTRIAQFEGLW